MGEDFLQTHFLQTAYRALLFEGVCLPGKTPEETKEYLKAYASDPETFSLQKIQENQKGLRELEWLKKESVLECFVDGAVQVTYLSPETREGKKVTAGAGFSVSANEIPVLEGSFPLPLFYEGKEVNSHIAEYIALVCCLQEVICRQGDTSQTEILLWSDSENLVKQMNGYSRIRDNIRRELRDTARGYLSGFRKAEIRYCPREKNQRADCLAKRGRVSFSPVSS